MLVAFQQKLNEVVAESANAVVKNDWVGIGSRQVPCVTIMRAGAKYATSFEFKRFDVFVEGLVPMIDSFFRAGQLHEIGTLRRLDNCTAQAVDRGAVFWSTVLRHPSRISTLNVDGTDLQPVNSQRFRFGFVFRGRPIGLLYLIDPAIDVRLGSTTLAGSKIKDDEQRVFPIPRGLWQFILREAHFRRWFFDRPAFGNFVAHISRRLGRRS